MKFRPALLTRFYDRLTTETTGQNLRATPSYFFLIWRWSMWFYALVLIVGSQPPYTEKPAYGVSIAMLFVTLIQTLIVTLYAPVIRHLFPRLRLPFSSQTRQIGAGGEEEAIPAALTRLRNPYGTIALYTADVLVCGLATYLTGPFAMHPTFGTSSPFYRYGISTAFAATLAYRYRGGLAAALGYDLFVVLGILFPPIYSDLAYRPNVIDIAGSLVDTPVATLVAAFIVTLLDRYIVSIQREQANGQRQKAQLDLGDVIIHAAYERDRLLAESAEQLRQGGRFERLSLAVMPRPAEHEVDGSASDMPHHKQLAIYTSPALPSVERMPPLNHALFEHVRVSGRKISTLEPATADTDPPHFPYQLYLPFAKQGQVRMVLGVEGHQAINDQQEDFLTIAGTQLLTALENIYLTEQTISLTAQTERNRIAREIHDGVAQLIYILKISTETCVAYTQRLIEASEEDAELLTPLEERLQKLVSLSKQALWETRSYMFSLKPLNQQHLTLRQMLDSQLREFETISELHTSLHIEGEEIHPDGNGELARHLERIHATIFRVVQESLTNAYKHAEATHIDVTLRLHEQDMTVEICDNGRGLPEPGPRLHDSDARLYSGHGLQGMRERVVELGGALDALPNPAGGLMIRAWIPLSKGVQNEQDTVNAGR